MPSVDTGRAGQRSKERQAYVPLFFAPGEAYQFDWSHQIVLINGVTLRLHMSGSATANGPPSSATPR